MGVASLAVVQVIDIDGVAVLEAEDHAPVGTDRHRPEPGMVSPERVKPEARQVHVGRAGGGVEAHQDVAHPFAVLGMDAARLAAFQEPPERPAPEGPYHGGP